MRWDVGLNRKRVACFRFGRDVEEYEARLMVREEQEEKRGEEKRRMDYRDDDHQLLLFYLLV